MTENDQADEQQQFVARATQLQARLFEILNRPEDRWSEQPCIAAHGVAETLRQVLQVIVTLDAGRLSWALELLEYVRQHVEAAAIVGAEPGGTRH